MKKFTALALSAIVGLTVASCSKDGGKTLTVGASPAPHAEILEFAKPLLEKEGVKLEIKEFTDYALQNITLQNGDIDANFFQHAPYLEKFNAENKGTLVSAGAIHFEPLCIYAGKANSLDAIADGASIAIPNDATNGARALLLLEKQGIIKLSGKGLESTVLDITENPKNVKITELEAAQIPNVLQDVDVAVINGNYAIGAGISADKVLAGEDAASDAATEFANIIAVQNDKEGSENIETLVRILQSEEVKKFINEKYAGNVLPVK